MEFYELLIHSVNESQYEELARSFELCMATMMDRISYEIGYKNPNTVEVLLYVEDDVAIADTELNSISKWFDDKQLSIEIKRKYSNT